MKENIEEIRKNYHKAMDDFKEINTANRQIYNKIEEKEKDLKKELSDLLSGK